jgi:hypothetical protein
LGYEATGTVVADPVLKGAGLESSLDCWPMCIPVSVR